MALERVLDILIALGCDYYDEPRRTLMLQFIWLTREFESSGQAIRMLAKQYHTYYLSLNSTLRVWLRPVLTADDSILAAFGLRLRARNPYAVAEALAAVLDGEGG